MTIEAIWRPADDDGRRDFFDVVDLQDGRIVVILGDAPRQARGEPALGDDLRFQLRRSLAGGTPALPAVAELDRYVARAAKSELVSLFVATVELTHDRVNIVNAGHPPALMIGPRGRATFLDDKPDALLGMATGHREVSYAMPVGSALCVFSDGLLQRNGGSLTDQDLDLLVAVAHDIPSVGAAAIAGNIVEKLGQPNNDATLLSIRIGSSAYQLFHAPKALTTSA